MKKSVHNKETISWIFLATALATQVEPANISGISLLADGINHAVPTHTVIQDSLAWLTKNELVEKDANKYKLTPKGKSLFESARHSGVLLGIWKELEKSLSNYRND